tara:strand:+ start:202 stop:1083 length:882 start_codon:yes stop_codon:yes gene_type:complete
MLSSKQVVFLAIVGILFTTAGYFFSLTAPKNQRINLQLLWQEAQLDCQAIFNAGAEHKTWSIEQFQFFISDIQMGSESSGWRSVDLVPSPFQSNDTVLLGTNCRAAKQKNSSERDSNWTIELAPSVDMSTSSSIRFTLGVPFAVNHLNPISQPSPLNLPSMFWVWQTGHKFVRLELASQNEQWLFHLGSTGCKSASVMRAPEHGCRYPNSVNFQLPIILADDNNVALNLNLAALLNNVELTPSSSCQSEQDSVSCQQLFDNLSLVKGNSVLTNTSGVFNSIKAQSLGRGIAVE